MRIVVDRFVYRDYMVTNDYYNNYDHMVKDYGWHIIIIAYS
jgi:hypothetical protein